MWRGGPRDFNRVPGVAARHGHPDVLSERLIHGIIMAKTKKRVQSGGGYAQGDMTPMIDMTFQLIAFFMVLINFADAQQQEGIKLPKSTLAKPPDEPPKTPVTLQVSKEGTVFYGGNELNLQSLKTALSRKRDLINVTPDESMFTATVIIRGDYRAEAGFVQEVIAVCQEVGFEKFALRAKQRALSELEQQEDT